MVHLDWRVESRERVALVELVIENPTRTARRVRVGNRLDGDVWPPRSRGVPEAGWDDGGFEGVVPPGDRRVLGYASPVGSGEPPVEPPAEIVWSERAGESERPERSDTDAGPPVESTPQGVVRALGDARPPADAVPDGTSETAGSSGIARSSDFTDSRWSR